VAVEKASDKKNWKDTAQEVGIMLSIAFINGVMVSMGNHAYETLVKGNKNGKVIPLQKVG
jgi:hypothetical protein